MSDVVKLVKGVDASEKIAAHLRDQAETAAQRGAKAVASVILLGDGTTSVAWYCRESDLLAMTGASKLLLDQIADHAAGNDG